MQLVRQVTVQLSVLHQHAVMSVEAVGYPPAAPVRSSAFSILTVSRRRPSFRFAFPFLFMAATL